MKSGFLLIDKPEDFTSFDVVAILRKVFKTKKIGHTGTLDPMATGLLLVCVNKATSAVSVMEPVFKQYVTTMRLGIGTDTEDITGEVIEKKDFDPDSVDRDKICDAVKGFIGQIEQVPPMYSAKKINGKKLYDIARAGQTVERKPVKLFIKDIEMLDISLPDITLRITCQKGTYIRTLCKDIGEALNFPACMTKLRRTETDGFSEKDAISLSMIREMNQDEAEKLLHPIDELFLGKKALYLTSDGDFYVNNGNRLENKDMDHDKNTDDRTLDNDGTIYRIYASDGTFKALYVKENDYLKAYKMFL